MAVAFFTPSYFEELAKTLNNDPEFQQKTASLTLTILMGAKDKGLYGLMKLDKGHVTIEPSSEDAKADFAFLGDYTTWVANHKGEAPLDKLVMTGKLKFKGSIPKIMGLRSQLLIIDRLAQRVDAEL